MEIYSQFIEKKNLVIALGYFDGVHLAHQKVISSAVNYAKNKGLKSAVITFKMAPACYFKNLETKYICSLDERLKYIEALGVDYAFVIDFSSIAKLTAYEYLKNCLVKNFSPKAIITGFNHTFGAKKSGNEKLLFDLQKEFGYAYIEIQPEMLEGEVISSTLIRNYLLSGEVEKANQMLGKSFSISGEVIQGQHLGRTIGFKTANLLYPKEIIDIKNGVYGAKVFVKDKQYRGILNLGVKPTVSNENKRVLEVNIFDFDENIYGKNIKVEFDEMIREEKKFSSIDELKNQISKDVEYWRNK